MDVQKVYLLEHSYDYGDDNEFSETKTLGIYSSQEKAEEAIKFYSKLVGFCNHPLECFYIDEFELDKNSEWTEGFISWEEAMRED